MIGSRWADCCSARWIGRVKQALGFPEEQWRTHASPIIERYANFVHLLPASENHHHRGAGGLFRHGLEVAYWSLLGAEEKVFSWDEAPSRRAQLTPRWRLAVMLAGLCHDVGKPMSDV